ncbi:MAG TPA: restriction endonuclease [Rhizomicrobium sp.]|jgi:restriction system protein|nr:restriction endonuclease [Rhizomicrobium sp.]
MYYIDIQHSGLNKFRRVTGSNKYVVEQKAQAQQYDWGQQWKRKCAVEAARTARSNAAILKDAKKTEALERTQEAEEALAELRSIIVSGLKQSMRFDWSALYDRKKFSDPFPASPAREPVFTGPEYAPRSSLLAWLIPSIQEKNQAEANRRFSADHEAWQDAVAKFKSGCAAWEKRKVTFEGEQKKANAKIDDFYQRYHAEEMNAITEYVDWILGLSKYPDCFPKEWQMDFVSETGVLIIDYELPSVDVLPKLKAVKYVQSRDCFEESYLREGELAQLYDDALYQTCLRTLYEIFQSDEIRAVTSVTFNGWVNFTDKSTGKPARACILSLQSLKEAFSQINLAAVDPKACFRSLKGVGSAKLAGMSAVVPILRLNKNDERFVTPHDVIDIVSEATNIAAIPWEEFEYLVRDLFEKEFSANGGEVKITRASRDHGVDAIAFDPDPIRGGKIVIQAKRYTNVVGVSAVRDLYGTLINEGANRGILVTTSQYGSDSYDFAKDKPITLLDGGNLLSLLDRHGHKARIDLVEAKRLGVAREQA